MNTYTSISDFGPSEDSSPQTNPLTYCALSGLESGFQHTLGYGTSLLGPNSTQCQRFMGQYCAQNFDGVCEYLSQSTQRSLPNAVNACNGPNGSCLGSGLGNASTSGQILIRNTAGEKYLKMMSGNCQPVYEPFDPTVAGSPLLRSWQSNCGYSNKCIPIYDVDAKSIDSDPVMNKILAQPWIAMDILTNIYNNRVKSGTMGELQGTKLYQFFLSQNFRQIVANRLYTVA
jgi:hypothetical protein